MSAPESTDIDAVFERIVRMSAPLHGAIAAFDDAETTWQLAGAPGVALFERDAGSTISHVSGSPAPDVMVALNDLRARHLAAAQREGLRDNSHLLALLLLCAMLADDRTSERLHLRDIARRPAHIVAIDEKTGKHDPELEPLDAALRAWTPLVPAGTSIVEPEVAVLQFIFPNDRHQKYVPWEGSAGETARLPG